MAKYIPLDDVLAEIKRLHKEHSSKYECDEAALVLEDLEDFLDTLEVKEVDEQKERMTECPFKKVGCEMYEGHILECKGVCSWVVDRLKLKQLKEQKGEEV